MGKTGDEDLEQSKSAEPTVAIETVGCKLNQAESEQLGRRFLHTDFNIVSPDRNPEVYILNTCTVTHIADRKCRQRLRAFRRLNPNALVVALGCYVDRAQLGGVDEVDIAVGNKEKDHVVEMVKTLFDKKQFYHSNDLHALPAAFRTRALVKIQDGCNCRCSYCIVPYVRGPEHSMPVEDVIAEVKARVSEGYKEVVLTGTRIGAYDGFGGLEGLVKRILSETNIPRLRLSSIQPWELSRSFIELWRDRRLCRHMHLALQSGSDSVLSRMRRGYSTKEYEEVVNLIRSVISDIAITTDVIVGFPGESEAEFEESYRFCERIGFARLHVFPYSDRPGTPASCLPGKISEKVRKARTDRMLNLAKRSAQNFRRRFSGEARPVLWEERKEDNLWTGYTDNYIKVVTNSKGHLSNCIIDTRLEGEDGDAVWGEISS